jgi:hypothetical protein
MKVKQSLSFKKISKRKAAKLKLKGNLGKKNWGILLTVILNGTV